MPELPEIETIYRGIEPAILNQRISAVVVINHQLRWPIPKKLPQVLTGQHIKAIQRRGKYLLLKTQTGTLIIHLGMSGNLQLKPQNHTLAKHEHVNIVFSNGLALCYIDPRRFGAILWTDKDPLQHKLLKNLGPEPLDRDFTAKHLFDRAKRCHSSIKQFIMNSKVVVGVGNIYANEALFAAKINPLCKASSVSLERYQLLTKKIKAILRYAIKHGGTTLRDYSDSRGQKGSFQNKLKVYGRQGQLCVNCKTKLKQIRLGQRSTVFCPSCQNLAIKH
ncbi:MAG: formamidopyrimidine-DNA glycosylase [uncultured bacterium]|nr:MAG: formamidopyrimidine-DNA glycosylase [uncultured bacterium]